MSVIYFIEELEKNTSSWFKERIYLTCCFRVFL